MLSIPRLNRTDPRARAGLKPIATSTWNGSSEPVRQARFLRSVAARAGNRPENGIFQSIAQGPDSRALFVEMFDCQLGRAAEADDVRNIFGAAAPVPFLMAANEVGHKSRASPDIEESDSLRGMK